MEETRLTAFICYKDPGMMVAWLRQVLGFSEILNFKDETTRHTIHAELRLDQAVVVIQADKEGYDVPEPKGRSVGMGLYLAVTSQDRVDGINEAAMAAGAKILVSPERTKWGNYHVELLDPEGRQWSIGTYMPGEAN